MSQVFQRYFQNIDWTRIADEVISPFCPSFILYRQKGDSQPGQEDFSSLL